MNVIDYTYPEFEEGIKSIARQIEEDDYEADYLVWIARGGCVPGVYLSHRLKKPIMMVQWNTRDESPFGNDFPSYLPRDILSGHKIILVDDMVKSTNFRV